MSDGRFSDERLRAALAQAAEVAGDGTSCPPAERLVLSGRGELPRGEEAEVILHIARCTACAAGWRVAREVAIEAVETALRGKRIAPFRNRWIAAAAAAALFVVAGVWSGVHLLRPERAAAPVYREQVGESLQSLVPEAEPLPRERFLLRWVAGPEGALYDVTVTTERMESLAWKPGLDRAECLVPESALEGLASGSRVFWQVSAHLPDGQRLDSPTFIASVR